jgi:hypothetical protein
MGIVVGGDGVGRTVGIAVDALDFGKQQRGGFDQVAASGGRLPPIRGPRPDPLYKGHGSALAGEPGSIATLVVPECIAGRGRCELAVDMSVVVSMVEAFGLDLALALAQHVRHGADRVIVHLAPQFAFLLSWSRA